MVGLDLGPSTRIIDKCVIGPILACVFTTIVGPLSAFSNAGAATSGLSAAEVQNLLTTPRPENKIFWPALAAISVVLAVQNRSRSYLASPHHLPPRVSCVCWSKRAVGFQTGAFAH